MIASVGKRFVSKDRWESSTKLSPSIKNVFLSDLMIVKTVIWVIPNNAPKFDDYYLYLLIVDNNGFTLCIFTLLVVFSWARSKRRWSLECFFIDSWSFRLKKLYLLNSFWTFLNNIHVWQCTIWFLCVLCFSCRSNRYTGFAFYVLCFSFPSLAATWHLHCSFPYRSMFLFLIVIGKGIISFGSLFLESSSCC